MSTNAFGSSDLDGRPPEMQRSTICYWMKECDVCGYVTRNMDAPASIDKAFLKTDSYRWCDRMLFNSSLTYVFYKAYLIAKELGDEEEAVVSLRDAAWTCDDAGDEYNARLLRKQMVTIIDHIFESEYNPGTDLLRADAIRRAGDFDKLISEYGQKTYQEDLFNKIIASQLKLAAEGDDKCHTVREAVEA